MAAGGSLKVVLLALFANLGIAIAKLVAAIVTGSGSMMAESIHSFADAGNQALLIVGHKRSTRPADEKHPLGYQRETYFWALLVAAMLFVAGGLYSLYEGVHKFMDPHPLKHVGWAVGVLLFGLALEGYSLRAAWIEASSVRGKTPLMAWARRTGRVNLLVVLFEDIAAQAGMLIALIAVLLTWVTDNPVFDALGSCVIGLLLLVVAVFIATQVRRLIVGLSATEDVRGGIRTIWEDAGFDVLHIMAIWDGPSQVLVAAKIHPRDETLDAATLMQRINETEELVTREFPEVDVQFIEPDTVK